MVVGKHTSSLFGIICIIMETLLKQKRVIKTKLTQIQTAIIGQTISPSEAEIYLDRVNQLGEQTDRLLMEINELCDDQQYRQIEVEFGEVDVKLHALKVILVQANAPVVMMGNVDQPIPTTSELRLPRIDLPVFSGNLENWITFHDLFVASIHSNFKLSGAQKLQYLKAALKGEPSLLIQSIPITDVNYKEAWEILIARYHNTREIINTHIDHLINQPCMSGSSPGALRMLVDTTNESVRAIRVLDVPVEHWDVILVHIISKKLDGASRRDWELSLRKDELPTFERLMQFLEQRARALAAAAPGSRGSPTVAPLDHHKASRKAVVRHGTVRHTCESCGDDHLLHKCKEFNRLSPMDRQALVKRLNLCFNCLHRGHRVQTCNSGKCRQCNQTHHTLLHFDTKATITQLQDSATVAKPTTSTHCFSDSSCISQVLLSTALVQVMNSNGQPVVCRALLDSGSQASFVTNSCVRKLCLGKQKTTVAISGISTGELATSRGYVELTFTSAHKVGELFKIKALILPKITGTLPNAPVNGKVWTHIRTLPLADPQFDKPGIIDILLGADIYGNLLRGGYRGGKQGQAVALETALGWVLMGNLGHESSQSVMTALHVQFDDSASLSRFWELEELPITSFMTPEENECEQHFRTTHSRDQTGRFCVQLPFHHGASELGASRDGALRRLKQVERRLSGTPDHQQYRKFMQEYLELGHMERVPQTEPVPKTGTVNCLPHHAVIKASSTTTRLRVVFDASAKTTSGVALNDKLMVGPKVQSDIFPLILRFRTHSVAMTADIEKMYRQVRVHPLHADYQRIIWRDDLDQAVLDYRLTTVTYGTASAPYLATKCLYQLAEDEWEFSPTAAAVIQRDFYVDDLISGAKSEAEALQLQSDLIELLRRGGFDLRKWSSNSAAVLQAVSPDARETSLPLLIGDNQSVKALGILWHPAADQFSFAASHPVIQSLVTKRTLLADISRLFDPLGWLAPITITAKLLMQSLWQLNVGWDEPIPLTYQAQWKAYCKELPNIQELRLDRCITQSGGIDYQIHAFCDASERAYGTVVYLRSTGPGGHIDVALVAAKTKVAPLKAQSLPRLELCGALLLSRLTKLISQSLNVLISQTHAWTDSTIVLAWLASSPSRWKTFVANRVNEIQENLPSVQWHHVNGTDNPADCVSRGISPCALLTHPLWWHGPQWLSDDGLPIFVNYGPVSDDMLEREKRSVLVVHAVTDSPLLTRFSSLSKLQRVSAWCLRFLGNARVPPRMRIRGPLSVIELNKALHHWIKWVQGSAFGLDIQRLQEKSLSMKSRLLSLNPYLDGQGLLRVGGRLGQSSLSQDAKHPLLLPHRNHLTRLIIMHQHLITLHGGPQLVLSTLQQRYWILGGRDAVRLVLKGCIICHRNNATMAQQMMADLPATRTHPARPFDRCGVDYAGPCILKVMRGRGRVNFKGYIALFICFVTRAIHLELVSELSTVAFLAALRRFVSRRGRPTEIHSDCGTNFLGTNRELRDLSVLTRSADHNGQIAHHLADQGISWHFNPPAAPHFGGLWEAGVKSMKYHLRRVVGNITLNFEEMSTVLTQIEACLNSRPLSALSSDPNDFSALTPGHFLVGGPLLAVPQADLSSTNITRLSRWQCVQQLVQHFWRRWSLEYLSRLQQRPKWWLKRDNLKTGDLVLIRDELLPPLKWKMGRIVSTHPGKDGLVRSVTVKTANGELHRPIIKLSPLPLDSDELEQPH